MSNSIKTRARTGYPTNGDAYRRTGKVKPIYGTCRRLSHPKAEGYLPRFKRVVLDIPS